MDQGKRIGFDAKRYFLNRTGLGNYSRWFINGFKSYWPEPLHLYHTEKLANEMSSAELHSPRGLFKHVSGIWRSRFIVNQLLEDDIRLFHGLSNELPFGIHQSGIRTVVTIHDLIQIRYPENYSRVDRSIYNQKVRYAQSVADRIIVPSDQTRKDLIEFMDCKAEKIEVIPIGSSIIPVQKGSANPIGTPYVLCVSSFNSRKNLKRLVNAFQNAHVDGLTLCIAGRAGETLNMVMRLSEGDDQIKLIVNPDDDQLRALYEHALFCVYPSLFEGFGIPVLEAFRYGKTIALGNRSSLPEVGGEAAAYFDPERTEEITKALEELYHSEKWRKHLESLIPLQLKQFDDSPLFARYRSVYESIL